MHSPFIVPLALFPMVVLLVAISSVAKIRDQEVDAHQRLHREEMEHRSKMQELDKELAQLKRS